MGLEGKVAVVTGAARGIGKTIAVALARQGADIAVCDIVTEDKAKSAMDEIKASKRRAEFFQMDVSSPESVNKAKDAILDKLGTVDILINNAGITRDKLFKNMDAKMWRDVISINLDGVFYCTSAFLPTIVSKGWGRIISISSVVGQMGNIGQVNYAASKAGVIGFTKSLAREVARNGVTVNAVAPGFVETDMTAVIPPDVREKIMALIPLKRFATPEEIAYVVTFLCDERANYITGQVIAINGGMYM
ncbi:MAG: 3-oxoacyl-[acyl-carrier-protein] reductase [Planctomycetota bacterium]|nr:3-oxoacyl-[acyl-carrier-protein] reductase [Planctomycetota bacterium]